MESAGRRASSGRLRPQGRRRSLRWRRSPSRDRPWVGACHGVPPARRPPRAPRVARPSVARTQRAATALRRPPACQVFESFDEGRQVYLVMEYLEGGALYDRIVKEEAGRQCLGTSTRSTHSDRHGERAVRDACTHRLALRCASDVCESPEVVACNRATVLCPKVRPDPSLLGVRLPCLVIVRCGARAGVNKLMRAGVVMRVVGRCGSDRAHKRHDLALPHAHSPHEHSGNKRLVCDSWQAGRASGRALRNVVRCRTSTPSRCGGRVCAAPPDSSPCLPKHVGRRRRCGRCLGPGIPSGGRLRMRTPPYRWSCVPRPLP